MTRLKSVPITNGQHLAKIRASVQEMSALQLQIEHLSQKLSQSATAFVRDIAIIYGEDPLTAVSVDCTYMVHDVAFLRLEVSDSLPPQQQDLDGTIHTVN